METSHLKMDVAMFLSLDIIAAVGSLYLFPSAAAGSISDADPARQSSVSAAERR